MTARSAKLVPLHLVHTDAYNLWGGHFRERLIDRINKAHAKAAIFISLYPKDDELNPESIPATWQINWASPPDWRRSRGSFGEEMPDHEVTAFERPGRPLFIEETDLKRFAAEVREREAVREPEIREWINMRNGARLASTARASDDQRATPPEPQQAAPTRRPGPRPEKRERVKREMREKFGPGLSELKTWSGQKLANYFKTSRSTANRAREELLLKID